MGPDNKEKTAAYFYWPDGTYTRVEYTSLSEFDTEDDSESTPWMWRNEEITGRFRVRKFGRKTFKKYLMSIGFGRDLAEYICKAVQKRGSSYSQAYIEWIFYAMSADKILQNIEEESSNDTADWKFWRHGKLTAHGLSGQNICIMPSVRISNRHSVMCISRMMT